MHCTVYAHTGRLFPLSLYLSSVTQRRKNFNMARQTAAYRHRVLLGLCLLLIKPAFSKDLRHLNRLKRDTQGDVNDDTQGDFNDDTHRKFSKDEFEDRLKKIMKADSQVRHDVTDDRDDALESSSVQRGLGNLFKHLEELQDRMPDDLPDFSASGNTQLLQMLGNNACLRNPAKLASFLSDVAEAMREFREEMHEELAENAADVYSRDMETPDVVDGVVEEVMDALKDSDPEDTVTLEATNDDVFDPARLDDSTSDDTFDVTSKEDTSEAFAASSLIGADPSPSDDHPSEAASLMVDSASNELDDIDMEDIFEKLSENSFECLSGFLDDADEKMLCRQFSHHSYRVFESFIRAGADCADYLDDDDFISHTWFSTRRNQSSHSDASGNNGEPQSYEEHFFRNMFSHQMFADFPEDDEDILDEDLDDSHQTVLLDQLMGQKRVSQWTSGDLRHAIRLAPDVLDAAFLSDLDDDVFDANLGLLGSLAVSYGADPGLRIATRQHLLSQNINKFKASDISKLGKSILALFNDDVNNLDPNELLKSNVEELFSSLGMLSESKDSDDFDDEDDDEEIIRLAVGHQMKKATISSPTELGKVTRFMFDDLGFLEKTKADDLFEAMDTLQNMTLDEDDAANLFRRITESKKFPAFNLLNTTMLRRMRGVLPGMSLSHLKQLPKDSLKNALDDLKDIDFGESQAREIVEDLFGENSASLTVPNIRGLGRLVKGLGADDLLRIDEDIISEVIDEFGNLELSDAQKKIIAFKAQNSRDKQQVLKMMQLPALANALSISDIDDLNNDDFSRTIRDYTKAAKISKMNWRQAMATTILNKIKTKGGRPLRISDIPKIKNLANGLLIRDLHGMIVTVNNADDLADALSNQEEHLTSSQVDQVLNFIKDKYKMETVLSVEVSKAFVAQTGVFLAYLPPSTFNKLKFKDDAKKAFLALMSKMDTRKMSRAQIQFLAEKMLDMMEDKAEDNKDEADYRKQKTLGDFVMGMSVSQIKQMSAKAIVNNLGRLAVLPLTKYHAEAVLDKVEEAEKNWKCSVAVLAKVGPLLQFAKQETIDKICEDTMSSSLSVIEKRLEKRREMIEERRNEGLWREDSVEAPDSPLFLKEAADEAEKVLEFGNDVTENEAGVQVLVNRMIQSILSVVQISFTGGRRRRATTGNLKCSMLRPLRQDISKVPVDTLIALSEVEFKDCFDLLGNATKWSKKDLGVLKRRAVEVYGKPSKWNSEILRQAGVIVAAMSPTEIESLNLVGLDAPSSIVKHAVLNATQLQAAFRRWLVLNHDSMVDTITPGKFSALSEMVCGISVLGISQLPHDVIKRSLDVIGAAKSCSAGKRIAYVKRVIKAIGATANWPPAVVGDLGHLVGGLNSSSIQQLDKDQLAMIKPAVISQLPLTAIRALTVKQLQQMSRNQINALTEGQFSVLSAAQRQIAMAKSTVKFAASTQVTSPPTENEEKKLGTDAASRSSTDTAHTDSTHSGTATTNTRTTTTTAANTVLNAIATTSSNNQRPVANTSTPFQDNDLPIDISYDATTDGEEVFVPVPVLKTTGLPKYEATTAAAKVAYRPRITSTTALPTVHDPATKATITTTSPKVPKPVTLRYIETTTRNSTAVTVKVDSRSREEDSGTDVPAMDSQTIRPDSPRGDTPWPNFHSNKPVSASAGEMENSHSRDNMVSSSKLPAEHGLKSSGSRTLNPSFQGAVGAAVHWYLTSLLGVAVVAVVLC